MSTTMETIDTREMSRYQMDAYLQELTREQREGIIYMFAQAEKPRPSDETIQLIAQAEGMGYSYDIESGRFMMEKPEEHDFLFWNPIPIVGKVDSKSGMIKRR